MIVAPGQHTHGGITVGSSTQFLLLKPLCQAALDAADSATHSAPVLEKHGIALWPKTQQKWPAPAVVSTHAQRVAVSRDD